MDLVAYGVIFALTVNFSLGKMDGILRRIPKKLETTEKMIGNCLKTAANRYNNSELVVLVRDDGDFARHWTNLTLNEEVTAGRASTIRFVKYGRYVPATLRRIHWTRHTLFVVVGRRSAKDDFFFADESHQEIGFEVIRNRHLEIDFPGLVTRNHTKEMRGLREVFLHFWRARVINVVALLPSKTNIYVYTYYPFTERNCPDEMQPVLIDVWSSVTGRFYRGTHFYPEKVNNVFGCELTVSLISSPPGVMAEKGTIDGIEGEMVKLLFSRMNATPKFHFVNSADVSMNESDTALNFLLENVKIGESELGAGFLIPTSAYVGTTDDVHIGVSLCLTWAVPNQLSFGYAVMPIIETFSNFVWIVLFLTIIVCSVVHWCLRRSDKRSLARCFFEIVSAVLGKPITFPKEKPSKLFLMSFIWCSIIVGSAFQAGLGSNNIISGPPPQLESTKEIVESGFEIIGLKTTVRLFTEDIKLIRNSGAFVHVKPMEIHKALLKVAFERRTAYIGLRLPIVYYIQFLYPELTDHIYVHKSCLLNYQPFFALRKHSPFTPRIRSLLRSFIESGFKVKLEEKYLSRLMKSRRRGGRVMSKGDALVRGSLVVLYVGLTASILLFVAECVFYHVRRRIRAASRRSTKPGIQ